MLLPVVGLVGVGDGRALASVAKVRMGVLRDSPVRRLCSLPAGVGELRPAAGADRTAGLAFGCLLRGLLPGCPPYLCLVLRLAGLGLLFLADVGDFAARVADRLKERLRMVSAETEEHWLAGPCWRSWFKPVAMIGIFRS
ncbi:MULTISPECIES: hypothetical protein [Streptomyces]|uniref:hypothetical protein n=1 Tax=Streptomyces TaxID=1883 RepID=UPI0004BD9C0F|nr:MULTISPECIES: hypothetical protein [Streptomyces]